MAHPSRPPRVPALLVGSLFLAAAIRVSATWGALPERMASHFDLTGQPDGFMARGPFFAFIAVLSVLLVGLPMGAAALLRHMPDTLINLPHRDYWLDPSRRASSLGRLQSWLAWFCLPTALLLAWVLELTLRANLTNTAIDPRALGAGFAVFAGLIVFLIVGSYRAFRLKVVS